MSSTATADQAAGKQRLHVRQRTLHVFDTSDDLPGSAAAELSDTDRAVLDQGSSAPNRGFMSSGHLQTHHEDDGDDANADDRGASFTSNGVQPASATATEQAGNAANTTSGVAAPNSDDDDVDDSGTVHPRQPGQHVTPRSVFIEMSPRNPDGSPSS